MPENKKWNILVVDDEESNVKLLGVILENAGYRFETAASGEEALKKIRTAPPDLVLLDVMMPGLNGYEVCALIREDPATRQIPVIMVTALADRNARIKGLNAGANDYLTKPVDSMEVEARTRNLLKLKEYDDFLARHNQLLKEQVNEKTRELRESYLETISRLTVIAKFRDEEPALHISRVGHYVKHLAKSLGMPDEKADILFYASPMHDIGKIGIPESILLRSGLLTQEEETLLQSHTTIGWRLLSGSNSKILQSAAVFALSHHEQWDGNGYPKGLKGEEIPLEGRLLRIVDQYDTLRRGGPFKPASDHKTALDIMTRGDGRVLPEHFDPHLLNALKTSHLAFNQIFEDMKDSPAQTRVEV